MKKLQKNASRKYKGITKRAIEKLSIETLLRESMLFTPSINLIK
tara:strand:+ start:213 stop:344 length:132 start_codon:yes stop_codon:yes gene_type:complete